MNFNVHFSLTDVERKAFNYYHTEKNVAATRKQLREHMEKEFNSHIEECMVLYDQHLGAKGQKKAVKEAAAKAKAAVTTTDDGRVELGKPTRFDIPYTCPCGSVKTISDTTNAVWCGECKKMHDVMREEAPEEE